ncbi:hypothetical protein BJ170DRAFT_462938 [Xylariales sp. AK1849]|nr:hypothetical protein BJ170DRAFT_462938 [Xylariales sp. AK1849]
MPVNLRASSFLALRNVVAMSWKSDHQQHRDMELSSSSLVALRNDLDDPTSSRLPGLRSNTSAVCTVATSSSCRSTTSDTLTRVNDTRNALSHNFSSWYTSESSTQCLDPAKAAFDNAVEVLKKDLSPSECDIIWLSERSSIIDVQKAVLEAQLKYQNRSTKSKIRSLLSSCSSRIVYYAPIFDTLCQQYPEYVSLAWGAFKFLFIAMINYEELLTEFSRAMANIANVLPRTKLLSELYRTPEMQIGVANVYAKIIEFVLETVKWYKKNKLQHAIAAVVGPYKLSFKDIVDEIAVRSRRVDELASTAVKAELRDVHAKVGMMYDENVVMRSEMLGMRDEMLMMRDQFRVMTQALIESQALQHQVSYHQQDQNFLLLEWQTETIRQVLESSASGSGNVDAMLTFGRSIRNRRRLRTPTQMPVVEISRLRAWVSDERSSLLVAQGNGIKNSSMDFAIDFLDAVLETQTPIIRVLPLGFEDSPSLLSILQSLVLQTMDYSNNATRAELHRISVQDLRSANTVPRWFSILERCLRRVEKLFVLIDLNLIQRASRLDVNYQENLDSEQFIDRLQRMVSARDNGWLKIILVSWPSDVSEQLGRDADESLCRIFTDRGIVQERRLWRPRLRGLARRQLRTSSQQLRMAVGLPIRPRGRTE